MIEMDYQTNEPPKMIVISDEIIRFRNYLNRNENWWKKIGVKLLISVPIAILLGLSLWGSGALYCFISLFFSIDKGEFTIWSLMLLIWLIIAGIY